MYEEFYALREKPFALNPDPAFLYLGKHHQHVLTLLRYALTHGTGFGLVTGEIGSGKTTLVHQLLGEVGDTVSIGLLSNTHAGMGALLPWVANAFGVKAMGRSGPELHQVFVERLLDDYAQGRRLVLIVDEAQNLDHRALEELRVLSNINTGKDLLLQTILVGQPELRTTLRRPELRQLAQRIGVDHHLEVLSQKETLAYVRHRLEVAGGSPKLFTVAAVDLLHSRSGGVPRLINMLCDMSLVYGFADRKSRIDAEQVAQVIRDRETGGVLPLNAGDTASKMASIATNPAAPA